MKILITAKSEGKDAEFDLRFGRAQGFSLYNDETDEITWHSNEENIKAAHGAGIQAGQNAAELGAEILITGHVGPKAFTSLKAANIKIYTYAKEESVMEVYARFKNNELEETTESH